MSKLLKQFYAVLLLGILSSASWGSVGPRVGETAPDFSLTDLNKKVYTLKGLRSKGHVLLVFWSTRCHVCHAMIPEFKKIHTQYKDKNLTLVAINVGFEDRDDVDDYAFEYKLNYLVLNDDDKKAQVAQDYRLIGTPTMELIAPDGKVLYRGHRIPANLDKLIGK